MFAAPNLTFLALVSPAILDCGVGLVGREFLVARKNKGPKDTLRTSDSKGSVKETRKRKKNVTLDRERTRDSIDGRHLGFVHGARFGCIGRLNEKIKCRILSPEVRFERGKKKEKEKRNVVAFAEARSRTLWYAKQRLYPLSHEVQHTKSETKLSSSPDHLFHLIRRLNPGRFEMEKEAFKIKKSQTPQKGELVKRLRVYCSVSENPDIKLAVYCSVSENRDNELAVFNVHQDGDRSTDRVPGSIPVEGKFFFSFFLGSFPFPVFLWIRGFPFAS